MPLADISQKTNIPMMKGYRNVERLILPRSVREGHLITFSTSGKRLSLTNEMDSAHKNLQTKTVVARPLLMN